ncbi:hypothetical protein ACNS7O_13515 [Haloferacaceae archaeon DSL9]
MPSAWKLFAILTACLVVGYGLSATGAVGVAVLAGVTVFSAALLTEFVARADRTRDPFPSARPTITIFVLAATVGYLFFHAADLGLGLVLAALVVVVMRLSTPERLAGLDA